MKGNNPLLNLCTTFSCKWFSFTRYMASWIWKLDNNVSNLGPFFSRPFFKLWVRLLLRLGAPIWDLELKARIYKNKWWRKNWSNVLVLKRCLDGFILCSLKVTSISTSSQNKKICLSRWWIYISNTKCDKLKGSGHYW